MPIVRLAFETLKDRGDMGRGVTRAISIVFLFHICSACYPQLNFPTSTPPVVTSLAFLDWAPKYVDDCVSSAPLERAFSYYFSPDGDDNLGDGSIETPFQTIQRANQVIQQSTGNVRLRFRAGRIFRSLVGLVVDKPAVTVDSYRKPGDSRSAAKPLLTRFEPPVAPQNWQSEQISGVYSTDVTDPVAWIKYVGDETTVFRRMTSLGDCEATKGSWFWNSGKLYVHTFNDHSLTGSARSIEYVIKNQETGIWVKDVANVRLHGLHLEGFGAGTPGDLSYNGYGIESDASGASRCVVTECETYYNGRHSMTKLSGGYGGSLVLVRCRSGWLVNDGINVVCYSNLGGQELVTSNCEYLGSDLPSTNNPYPYGGGQMPILLHSSNDFAFRQAFFLSYQDRIIPGQYQCAEIPAPNCASPFTNLVDCRSFVIGLSAPCRSKTTFDETKPSSNGGNGLVFKNQGGLNTVYAGCVVKPSVLWTQDAGDVSICSTGFGTWINSEITFDFSACDVSSSNRVLSLSGVNPAFPWFASSYYACRLRFISSGGGAVLGFSGPMIHQFGNYYDNIQARWQGVLKSSVIDVQGLGTGKFLLGWGNDANGLDGNAYYGITDETGAYGCDQDAHRVIGTSSIGRPQSGSELLASDPIKVMGQILQYDMLGRRRGKRTAIGPVEGPEAGLPGYTGPGINAGG